MESIYAESKLNLRFIPEVNYNPYNMGITFYIRPGQIVYFDTISIGQKLNFKTN